MYLLGNLCKRAIVANRCFSPVGAPVREYCNTRKYPVPSTRVHRCTCIAIHTCSQQIIDGYDFSWEINLHNNSQSSCPLKLPRDYCNTLCGTFIFCSRGHPSLRADGAAAAMEAVLQAVVVLLVFVLTVAVVGLAWLLLWHIVLRKLPFIQEMLKKKKQQQQQQPPPPRSDGGSGGSGGGSHKSSGGGSSRKSGTSGGRDDGATGGGHVVEGNGVDASRRDSRWLSGKPHSS